MDRRSKIARGLVTIPAVFVALVPPLVDLNETHVLNPLWTGHARLHTVWLIATNSLVSLIALGLLWLEPARSYRGSLFLSAGLVGAVLFGFLVAAATQPVYGGALTDPNGVALTFGPLDANLAVFSTFFFFVLAAIGLARKPAA